MGIIWLGGQEMQGTKYILLAGVVALSLGGCKTTELGSAIGSTVGGMVGTQIGGVAAYSGYQIGGLVGEGIGEYLDEQSRLQAEQSASVAVTTGQNQTWSNPNAGTSGTVEVVAQEQQTMQVAVPVLKDRVEETPPLDLVGGSFVVQTDANVRGGPGTDYKAVGSLKKGQTVEVVGQVQGKDWYMISQGGVASGFVSTSLLQPAPKEAPPSPPPAGEAIAAKDIDTKQIPAKSTCRTIKQTVKLKDGSTKTGEDVTACQTPTGWEVSEVAGAGRQSRP